ncbi:TetR/AcrR family transcriptional regulator [Streptomyces goshikiensis]|uniref:TetR/AcrR family transcriptional regulator n=1 Tax=Streptomyces goshikiensis TaxID=1942 RepID=UPI0036793321
MTSKQPAQRLRKSPGQVRSAVHQAVIDLLSDPGGADLTIPVVAQRAGVNHTSIYRHWGGREALLADVVITRLERDSPLADTGTLRGDLRAWAEAGVASIRDRATARGEVPPPLDQILDQLVAPLYLRAIFDIEPPASGYPDLLVDRLLGGPDTPRPS